VNNLKLFVMFAFVCSLAACGTQPQAAAIGDREVKVDVGSEPAFTTRNVNGVSWAVPKGMDLERYPILGRKLTPEEVIRMRLRLDVVPPGTVLFNEDPKHRAFWFDTIRKERRVWRNEASEIVYIEDCGNRAMKPLPYSICPTSVVCAGPHIAPAARTTPASDNVVGNADGGYNMPEWIRLLWHGLGNLLLFLLALALLAVLLALAYFLARLLYDLVRRGGQAPANPQPQPVVPVRPRHFGPRPVQPVVGPAPAPPPPPIPVARFHRYGPYDHISNDNAGAEGFRVTGYNGDQEIPLGTFQWAGTENAGDRGEFVIVMV